MEKDDYREEEGMTHTSTRGTPGKRNWGRATLKVKFRK